MLKGEAEGIHIVMVLMIRCVAGTTSNFSTIVPLQVFWVL